MSRSIDSHDHKRVIEGLVFVTAVCGAAYVASRFIADVAVVNTMWTLVLLISIGCLYVVLYHALRQDFLNSRSTDTQRMRLYGPLVFIFGGMSYVLSDAPGLELPPSYSAIVMIFGSICAIGSLIPFVQHYLHRRKRRRERAKKGEPKAYA